MKGTGNGTVVVNEAAVEVGEAQEALKSFSVFRNRPVLDSFYLSRIHLRVAGREDKTKKRDGV